ncbi:hypothetical protein FUAX_23520 [Fulvitalea axinellae]|uniref:FAS1 domain-containing protein n=1 Tax=Fulvitalea axinellae TaxID=1182444 RepID=A0AAU9CKS8_9BACT|nr:hypothetical protein FUAX_23520 [Fulvitalea axinellae]
MRIRLFSIYALSVLFAGLLMSCEDAWEDHYEGNTASQYQGTVSEYLQSKPEYARFWSLVKKHGIDQKLAKGGSNTVFAVPDAGMASFDGLDEKAEADKIAYHAGNALVYGYNVTKQKDYFAFLKTFLSKNVRLSESAGTTWANREIKVTESDIVCSDGVVHVLEKALLPTANIYEQLQTLGDEYDAFKKYVSKDTLLFDRELSVEVGKDEFGRTVYDSVFVPRVYFLVRNGDIAHEDSTLTCFALNETAMQATFDDLVMRYYGDESNLPENFDVVELDRSGQKSIGSMRSRIMDEIRNSTVWTGEATVENMPDTLEMTTRRKVIVKASDAGDLSVQSNGYLYTWNRLGLLASDVMGDTLEFESENVPYFTSPDNTLIEVESSGSQQGFFFNMDEPVEVTVECEKLIGGKYMVYYRSAISGHNSLLDITVDGKKFVTEFQPRGNWLNNRLGTVNFDAFGKKVIKIKTLEPYNTDEGLYGISFDKLIFIPYAEHWK